MEALSYSCAPYQWLSLLFEGQALGLVAPWALIAFCKTISRDIIGHLGMVATSELKHCILEGQANAMTLEFDQVALGCSKTFHASLRKFQDTSYTYFMNLG